STLGSRGAVTRRRPVVRRGYGLVKDGRYRSDIGGIERRKFKESGFESGHQLGNRYWMAAQQPRYFRQHRPAGQQRRPQFAELGHAPNVVFVGFPEDRHDRAGVQQHPLRQDSPNPSKCRGFVLRSRLPPLTAPISPAFNARSYAVSPASDCESCRSKASRTRLDSRFPVRTAVASNLRRRAELSRTEIRYSFMASV